LALLNEQIEGKYEILGKIREGGMGAVYKVRHRLLDEVRVVKVVRSQVEGKSTAAERFLHEARVAIRLRHPNVALLHDFAVDDDGTAYIVMEYIDGWSLLEVLESYGPPPFPLTLEIARQALRALGYLHRQQIVHRDISPDNIMLTRDGEGHPLVKLIDLGIAKAVGATGGLTTTGVFLGKPRYASPEQFEGRGVGPQSDLYSFAVVLYELLTGRCPVHGQDAPSFMAGHLLRPPLDFDEVDPRGTVPADLRTVVMTALAKKPQDRMPGAEELVRSIAQVQERYPWTGRDFGALLDVLLPLGAPQPLSTGEGATPTSAIGPRVLPVSEPTRQMSEPLRGVPTAAAGDLPLRPAAVGGDGWDRRQIQRTEAALAETVAVPLPALAPAPPPARRTTVLMAAAVALTLLAGGIGWHLSVRSNRPPPPTPEITPRRTEPAETATAPATRLVVPASLPAAAAPEPTLALPSSSPAHPAVSRPPRRGPAGEPAPSPAAEPITPADPMKRGDFLRTGPGVSAPVPLELARYEYPAAARGSGRRVSVRVAILVDEDGKVMEASLRDRDDSSLGFNEIALDAARRTRFLPGTRDDIPGRMWTELIFDFAE
jgi:serine/threonine-protein kinase